MLGSTPAAVAGAALVVSLVTGAAGRLFTGWLVVGVATTSLLTTSTIVLADGIDIRSAPGLASQAEVVVLLTSIVVAARWAPRRQLVASTVLGAGAVGAIALRVHRGPLDGLPAAGVAIWALVGLGAAAIGLYLRSLEERRQRSVFEAQRTQRLHLALDLHDFVAHDVSEMLALAQAGQVLAAGHPRSAESFAKIEHAAQRALRSMDRTVEMLHVASVPPGVVGGDRSGQPTIEGLVELVERFTDANGIRGTVHTDGFTREELGDLPAEASMALYRVAVEALTNVRRHAPTARSVHLAVRRSVQARGATIELSVRNDGGTTTTAPTAPVGRQNGLGLPTLAERVEYLGGRFEAGPDAEGWQVTATLPWEG